jgi:hypothetical protein
MDVQATTTTAVLPPLPITPPSPTPAAGSATAGAAAVTSTVPVVSGTDPGSSNTNNSVGGNPIGPNPGLATLPASASPGADKEASATIASGVAKLYNAQEQNVSVSFQIEQDPNEIVTVFTDKQTGKVIVQFPSETLVALAKFFDKLDGSVVNKKV